VKSVWRLAAILVTCCLCAVSPPSSAENVGTVQRDNGSGNFSASSRQADLARLRDFVYPKGYSDQQIVTLENGQVPADLPVNEYARLHCGESNRFVLHPCIIRYADGPKAAFYVVLQDANMRFGDLASATTYYRERIADTASHLAMEIDEMNTFVDDFCAKVAAGERPGDILSARGGRPRIHHPIAPIDAAAKYQFSNLFSWDKCKDCVGIIAINQPAEQPPPSCGALRKQGVPHITYFVVDRDTSKGHRSLDDGLKDFSRLAAKR